MASSDIETHPVTAEASVVPQLEPLPEATVMAPLEDAPPPPPPPPPTHVEEEDRLRAETATLRHQLAASRIRELEYAMRDAQNAEAAALQRLQLVKAGLTKKYKVDFTRHIIREEDGAILPIRR